MNIKLSPFLLFENSMLYYNKCSHFIISIINNLTQSGQMTNFFSDLGNWFTPPFLKVWYNCPGPRHEQAWGQVWTYPGLPQCECWHCRGL